jgi:hypothetical protein
MPLSEGTTKESREKNIEREIEAGKDPKQAVAIGYSKQRSNVAKKAAQSRDQGEGITRLINDLCMVRDALKAMLK